MSEYPFLDLQALNAPFSQQIRQAADRVMRSGRYIGGPEIDAFERELAASAGTPHAVGCANGLDAIRLILRGLIELGRLSPGDEVIVPANTYIATLLAVTDCRLTPVPVDPDEHTFNLSAPNVEAAITPRTRAILTVHLYGRVAWSPALRQLAIDRSLWVIEDNAQAIGAVSDTPGVCSPSLHTGGLGHAAAFSFYPTKNIGALGDAGAVTTHDLQLAQAVRAIANYGSDRRYHNIYCGLNSRLDPLQAAILRVKLPHAAAIGAARFARAACYNREISNPLVTTPAISPAVHDHVWHQYVVRIADGRRDHFRRHLADHGVATDIHYPTPPHLQPCYRGTLATGPLPVTERLASEIVSLPISTATSVAQAAEIARIINTYR